MSRFRFHHFLTSNINKTFLPLWFSKICFQGIFFPLLSPSCVSWINIYKMIRPSWGGSYENKQVIVTPRAKWKKLESINYFVIHRFCHLSSHQLLVLFLRSSMITLPGKLTPCSHVTKVNALEGWLDSFSISHVIDLPKLFWYYQKFLWEL